MSCGVVGGAHDCMVAVERVYQVGAYAAVHEVIESGGICGFHADALSALLSLPLRGRRRVYLTGL